MRSYRTHLFAAIVIPLTLQFSAFAQENIAPHVEELPQRINFNPALSPNNVGYFTLAGLGGVNISAENTGFCFDDLFTRGTDDTLRLDLGRLAKNMKKTNFTSVNIDVPILSFGVRINKGLGYLSFGIDNKTMIESKFDRNITSLWKGNWNYDTDEPVNHHISKIFVRAMNYLEFSGGYSSKLPDINIEIGGRVKFLMGTFAVLSDDVTLDIQTEEQDPGRYSVAMQTSGSIKTSIPVTTKLDADGYVDKITMDDFTLSDIKPSQNKGVAFDLGVTWMPTEDFKLGLSAIDIGFIKWHNDCQQFNASASYTFRGVDFNEDMKTGINTDEEVENDDSYWSQLKDSLLRVKDITLSWTSFKTRLSSRLIATADFRATKWLSLGATVATKFVDKQAFTRSSVSALLHAGSWLTFAGTAAINPGFRFSPGVGIFITGGPVQFYVLADRFPHNLSTSTGTSVSTGINFVIKKSKLENREENNPKFR
ncbi:MAG: hypothetical protein IKR17_12060 [Bacteroidales bacterium]|nr:hypothetical protein [Bacteroidales bacterium]